MGKNYARRLSGRLRRIGIRLFVSCTPFALLMRLAESPPVFPFYHTVSDEALPHIVHLYQYRSVKEFKAHLELFLKNYVPLAITDLRKHILERSPIPRNSFILTFDDGLREQYDIIAPLLKNEGLQGAFFLNSAFLDNRELFYRHKASLLIDRMMSNPPSGPLATDVRSKLRKAGVVSNDCIGGIRNVTHADRAVLDDIAGLVGVDFDDFLSTTKPYMTTDQVNSLISDGHFIGAHSIDHPHYSLLTEEEQIRQTVESTRYIRERFSLEYGIYSFPFTDRTVPVGFFSKLREYGIVDVTFGTGGIVDESERSNIHRLWVENRAEPLKYLLKRELALKILRKLRRKDTFVRR